MNTLVVISFAILFLYVYKLLKYKQSWEHYPESKPDIQNFTTGISVIVAFRNEANNLPALLNSLATQDYPVNLFEVILVNDHSGDASEILAERFCTTQQNFRLMHNVHDKTGKKAAIIHGIERASFDLLVTTDADCTPAIHWLASIAQQYQEKHPDMIVGLVDITSGKGFFSRFQEIEFLGLVAAGAGAVAGGNPLYCNGANLAFTKSLFHAYTDPFREHVTSGEDTFFMHTVKKDPGRTILLLKAIPSVVVTKSAATWNDFMQQRKRWVSKSLYYRDAETIYVALLVFLNCMLILISLFLFVSGRNFMLFPVMYLVKTLTDIMFLRKYFHFCGKKIPVMLFTVYELIYPLYMVFFTITGIITGNSWKGRSKRFNYQVPT
jgi:cellulose synthase/poly-beta-1,6-N-acetylglucosamine synthase-like glycosyltransferase